MRAGFPGRRSLHRAASGLLAMVFLRALVPAGFMPDAERPFSLALCPDGSPAYSPAMLVDVEPPEPGDHHAHDGHVNHGAPLTDEPAHEHAALSGEHCLFGAASGLAPEPQATPVVADLAQPAHDPLHDASPIPPSARYGIAQPRAPPAFS
jgi:hypothetical protein